MYYVVSKELAHHGIKGQKWGVRRFQNEDGSLKSAGKARYGSADYYQQKADKHVAKIATSKTRLGKNIHNLVALNRQAQAYQTQALDKSKGLKDIISNTYGHGSKASAAKATSEYYQRKAEYSKTHYGKTVNEARAFNAKTMADAASKISKAKNGKEWIEAKYESIANRPIKTWSGRRTTTGKYYMDQMLTGGLVGGVQDWQHYRENKPKKAN